MRIFKIIMLIIVTIFIFLMPRLSINSRPTISYMALGIYFYLLVQVINDTVVMSKKK